MAPKSLKRKPVAEIWSEPHRQQSQCPRPADILMQWKQSLSDEIVIIENTYTALRGSIGASRSAEALIAESAQLIEGTIASCRDILQRFECRHSPPI